MDGTHVPPPRGLLTRDRTVALVLLLAGWGLAVALYMTTPPDAEDPDVYDMEHSRIYLRQVEVIGGKAAVFTSELNDSIASLWEGRARSASVAALSVIVAGGYLLVRRVAARAREDRQDWPRT